MPAFDLKQLGEQLGLVADAGGGIAQLPGLALALSDEVPNRARRKCGRRDQTSVLSATLATGVKLLIGS